MFVRCPQIPTLPKARGGCGPNRRACKRALDLLPIPVRLKLDVCVGDLISILSLFHPERTNLPSVRLGSTTIILFLGKKRLELPFHYEKSFLQPKTGTKERVEAQDCIPCEALKSTLLYKGIMDRIKYGVRKNTPLQYHGIGVITAVQSRSNARESSTTAGRKKLFLC